MPLPQHRVALLVEYDGTNYFGMQRQLHTPMTIQGKLEEAAATLGAAPSRFIPAGRTDTGVHALGQVVILELPTRLEEKRIARALNALLPEDIRVRRAVVCDPDFSPRHDAIQRSYLYHLTTKQEVCPMRRGMMAFDHRALDEEKAIAAAKCFVGAWDLKEWAGTIKPGKRTYLNVDEAQALPPDPEPTSPFLLPRRHWTFLFRARSFLHHQVRYMVGGIVAVGCGDVTLEELQDSLQNGKRPLKVKMMPASGLVFKEVKFMDGKDPFGEPPESMETNQ